MTDIIAAHKDLERRRGLMEAATMHLNRAAGNLKLAAHAVSKEDQDSIAMHAADLMVNLVEMCDMYSIPVMSNVFKRLEQIDRQSEA